jgi:peptidoglycan hydrolase-like protein with peptidoglycan-binding domain/S1-C subfamily serine protease
MRHLRVVVCALLSLLWAGVATAQDRAWVQIEAHPTLAEAEQQARAYMSVFPDVQGFRLGSRWYGIALGPYSRDDAAVRLTQLRRENLIPVDSFISDGSNFREQYWPVGGTQSSPVQPLPAAPAPEAAATAVPAPTDPVIAEPRDETPAEARRSEALLTADERKDLQRALQWQGFYNSAIDGAFGAGTRRSMADWQTAMGLEPTGILTQRQRGTLVANWQADLADYGFQTVTETEAGIEVTLPLGLVAFDHYEPPFVHFAPKVEGGMRVILISQPGDRAALYGLYDILQTLALVPVEGARSRNERSFEINGANATVQSYAYAELSRGLVKGYLVVWSPEQAEKAGRVLTEVKASFRAVGNRALDPGMVAMTEAARRGLLAGLELRRPKFSRSGFYVDGSGKVVTSAEAVAQCGRITLDGVTEASVTLTDAATGLAVLTPKTALSPPVVAGFQLAADRIGAEIAVAGYAYEDTLPAPVVTYGTLEDVQGLNGEAGLKRLGIATLPGDAGGPVIDGTGAVLGMLLPRATDSTRVLPEGVEFATASSALVDALRAGGVATTEAPAAGAMAPEDLTRKAMGMTVLVSCWE